MVALPERVAGGAQVQLAFVARPEHAFVTSAPYQLPVCAGAEQAGNVSAAACSESRAFWDEAMYGGPGMLSPSVLQSGAETARFALTVTAPPDLQLLWATHAEHVQALEGALGPLHACCPVGGAEAAQRPGFCKGLLHTHDEQACKLEDHRSESTITSLWLVTSASNAVPQIFMHMQAARSARRLRSSAASAPTCWASLLAASAASRAPWTPPGAPSPSGRSPARCRRTVR